MMKSHWVIRAVKDGHAKYCIDLYGYPMTMVFEPASAACQPFQFATEDEAKICWSLYQKSNPAEATDWIAYFEEVDHGV